jgi:hypothetical protein
MLLVASTASAGVGPKPCLHLGEAMSQVTAARITMDRLLLLGAWPLPAIHWKIFTLMLVSFTSWDLPQQTIALASVVSHACSKASSAMV